MGYKKLSSALFSKEAKLMCSYGGTIQPKPCTHRLGYSGGDTKIFIVDQDIKFTNLVAKLRSMTGEFFKSKELCIKYKLPGQDLDVLISVINDEDVKHMMLEYYLLHWNLAPNETARFRLFLFPGKPISESKQIGPLIPDYAVEFDKEFLWKSQPNAPASYLNDLRTATGTVQSDDQSNISTSFDSDEMAIGVTVHNHGTSRMSSVPWTQVVYLVPVVMNNNTLMRIPNSIVF